MSRSTKKFGGRFQKLEKRLLLAADLSADYANAPAVWSDAGDVHIALAEGRSLSDESAIRAEEFDLFLFDDAAFGNALSNAKPDAFAVPIPRPDGTIQTFVVQTTNVMAPELAAQFPEIQTYAGNADGGSNDRVWISRSPYGFHAQVFSLEGDYFVDPYFVNENVLHASYWRDGEFEVPEFIKRDSGDHDHGAADHSHEHVHGDLNHDHEHGDHEHDHDATEAALAVIGQLEGEDLPDEDLPEEIDSGDELRIYRLAVATTGEYTTFHGGTVASGLAAVVTAVNRVSGIYETELSIRLQLVANNNLLIYTNPATDPYTNNNDIAMLSENQTNVDNVIGNANYDIGHVFSTSGGGVAGLGVVGITGNKARGTTGLPSPIGDPFYVDYVSHEMGHQFAGAHTFNGDSGNCSGGNRSAGSAYEPGSGSTIQAYAGICGNDNLQPNSDPYFHFRSLEQILNHVDNVIPAVGTRTSTGNSIPTVDGGLDFTIPARTPFELTAIGSDADAGDVLTYAWEQRDLGPQQDVNAGDNGSSPLFRSWNPTTDPTRVFPRLQDLLAGTTVIGETLPTTNRDLNFRVTVRDNQASGAINTDDVQLTVIDTGQAFSVSSPNNGTESWPAFSTQTVTWNVASTNQAPISTANVDILVSTDGGQTFTQTVAAGVPNDGSHDITVPNTLTTEARIKVRGDGNVFFDVSNADFEIVASAEPDDFGDAPDTYGTLLADNGARHTASALTLGATVDTEPNGTPGVDADGDGGDEDGVRLTAPLVADQSIDLQVESSGTGVLNYFADFNGDGVFQNDGSENFTQNVTAGIQTVPLPIPVTSVADLYMRFRLSTAGGLGPTGAATDGEVEDYRFTVFATSPDLDFGDAPADVYATDLDGNGPRHLPDGVFLGQQISDEMDALDNPTATSDQGDDGVTFNSPLAPGANVEIDIESTGGVLEYFFDFNDNGDFEASESFSATVAAGADTVNVAVPSDANLGVTFARFRISSTGGNGPVGFVFGGEVEDYQVMIRDVSGDLFIDDFDASNSLSSDWTVASTGANGWTVVTSGSDTAPNHAFVEDIASVSDATLTSRAVPVAAGQQLSFRNFYNTEGTYDGGVLEISIGGGAFQDILTAGGSFAEGGYVSTLSSCCSNPLSGRNSWNGDSGGYIDTIVNLPGSAIGQDVRFRWRMGTDSSVSDDGWHIDTILLDGAGLPLDFGDAPSTYPTTAANQGAAHGESALFLGTTVTTEGDGQPTANADGDSGDDGITFPANVNGGQNTIGVVTSEAGILNAWIDFNDDGDWEDAGEQVVKDQALASGTSDVTVTVPEFASTVVRNARFRLSNQSALSFLGTAPDGEVEDYRVTIVPPIPDVQQVTVNAASPQRSLVRELQIPFDTEITASSTAFRVRNRATDQLVENLIVSNQVVDGRTTTTITFGAGALVDTRANGGNSLQDGNYQLEIVGSQVTAVTGGSAMAADYFFGTQEQDRFFRFFGDVDGDRDNDIQDLGRFGQTFRKVNGDADFDELFDYEGDLDVDISDLGQFGNRFRDTMSF